MAKRAAFEIGGQTIAPGTRRTIDLPVSEMSDHTPISLSVHVVHGRRAGPVVFVSAGVHGDEVIGVEIVRRLLRAPQLETLRGTLIVVPVVNSLGFIARSRYLPDRRDLNRSFPGSERGSLASRLAHIFMQEVLSRADLGIDLHSAAVHRTNAPQIRISPGNKDLRALAEVFGAPVILPSAIRDGSMRGAAAALGCPVLLFEGGEGLRFDEGSVRAGVAGIMRVLAHQKMIAGKGISKAKVKPQFCASSTWMRAPMGGLLRTYRSDGELVREGELLGALADPFGQIEVDLTAPEDGIIIGRAVMPVVNEGDAIFHLARVPSPDRAEEVLDDLAEQLTADPMFDEDEII